MAGLCAGGHRGFESRRPHVADQSETQRQIEEKRRQDQAETDRLAREAQEAQERRNAKEWK